MAAGGAGAQLSQPKRPESPRGFKIEDGRLKSEAMAAGPKFGENKAWRKEGLAKEASRKAGMADQQGAKDLSASGLRGPAGQGPESALGRGWRRGDNRDFGGAAA